MIKQILTSIRPRQWYKNLVVFIAIIFSHNLTIASAWIDSITAFIIFCLLSGSVYLINDIIDIEKDRQHPTKRNRPIASGNLKRSHAFIIALILLAGCFYIAFTLNTLFGLVSISYLLLFLTYSLLLKHIVIVDVLTISTGFVFRAIGGAVAISVVFSPWLVVCTFLLALFLALGKRRHELILLGVNANYHRKILDDYSVPMLEQMITITTSSLVISYSMYTFLTGNYYNMMLTIPFAIYGLFRYLHLIHLSEFGGEPEMIFKDKGMLISMILWGVLVVYIHYRS
ncbi:MAG: decaprenyl-phosphate phosphoribosyltransferase [ANME-2 cluster archaeon]|nr:MAG: decaprenyl-phosphate phosphoribosyltransferase [ANME-2 cluster archaeon]